MENQLLSGIKFKEQYGTEFYKILKNDLCHQNFQYVEGENTYTIKFNPTSSCSPGGLYFTNLENIYNYVFWGEKVCKVIIDDDSLVYVENNDEITKFKANKITIKNIQIIYDSYLFDTENKCKLAVTKNGLLIKYIINSKQIMIQPYIIEEIYKLALSQNGLSIQYIKDEKQTEEICKLAVSQNGLSMQYIKDEKQTEEICKLAVSQNAH